MELSGKMDNGGLSESDGAVRQVGAHPDRAMHLARLLERRGIRLSMRWRDALPALPVRVFHVLKEAEYETLAEVLQALRNDGAGLMGKKNFGRKSLNDLWRALEDAAGPGSTLYQSALFESSESSENLLSADQLEIEGLTQSLSEHVLARLEAAGVNPDQPWQNELPLLSTRLRNVLSERFVSLREVVIAATDGINELRKTKNLGRNSLNELAESLEMLAQHGPGYMRYGEQGAPATSIDGLVAQALQSLPDNEGRLLVRRYLDGAKLEQLGREYDLTRERIRQKVTQILIKLHRRLGKDASELAKPLIEATETSGGLLHRDRVLDLAGTRDIRHAWLTLLIAGADSFRIWRGEFLTALEREDLERRLIAIRNCFRDNRNKDLYLPDVAELVVASSGFRLDQTGLTSLLTNQLDCQIAEDGSVTLGGVRVPDRLEKILRAAGRPMHISEVARIYLASSTSASMKAFAGIEKNEDDGNGEDDALPDEERNQELAERALASAIIRHEDIYLCGPKTFVHINALPIPIEKFDEIIDLCVSRMEGETGAVKADYLLKILDGAGLGHDGLNKFLLKDALSRRPEIIGLRKFRVGHAASFQEHGLKLIDRIEAILRQSERPLSSIEIIRRLPRNNEYFPVSISLCLRRAPFAVNLGEQYAHLESLGLSEEQRGRLVEMAVPLLPEDGTPISCTAILNSLRPYLPDLGLAGRDDAAGIIRGLLRLRANVQWGTGYLVARRIEGRGQTLLKELILQIIRDAVVVYPRDILRELANKYGEQQSHSTITAYLNEAIKSGRVRRLPASLCFLSDVDEMALLKALETQDQAMRNMIEATDSTELSTDDLWLFARYCYQQNDNVAADRLLSVLQMRGDLTDERRRSCNRLRSVTLSRI